VTSQHTLTIVGLGPGDPALLTHEARDVLAAAPVVWLRTARHPTVTGLPAGPRYESFDEIYETGASFEQVYEAIVGRVFELAAAGPTVYAVPGHPLFGEATVRALLDGAPGAGIDARVVAGISFVDVLASLLRVDPLEDGLLMLDALAFVPHRRLLVPERPTLIAQVYDRRAASEVKLALLEQYPAEHTVRVVSGAGTAEARVVDTALATLDHSDAFDHLTSIYVPPLSLTEDVRSFEGLRAVIARLRSPDGGCPWDLQQTHATLKRFLLEEAYEALEALEALDEGEPHRLAEELGDLLMQIVLHAQVGEDGGTFAIEDVFGGITAKLIRRHPHVFGDVSVEGPEDVVRNWEALKKDERPGAGLLDAVPLAMPALAQAQSVQSRAEKAGGGLEQPSLSGMRDALERLAEAGLSADDLGDLLFAIVSLARQSDVDAEEALRTAIRRFRARVSQMEAGR
jgi:tetrapyrrole methylase family protein/MazG family protein